MLHDFLESKRAEIITRSRAKFAERTAPRLTEADVHPGDARFYGHLLDVLMSPALQGDEMDAAARSHGDEMLRLGFTVGQVVNDYSDVHQAMIELAFEHDAPITAGEFHTINRRLDSAIAQAVTEYGRIREQVLADQGAERIGVLAHELRNRLHSAILSFGILKSGKVSIGGGTGALLERSLNGLGDLVDRSLAEVRLPSTGYRRETILVDEFVEELLVGATLEAEARNIQLTVDSVPYGIFVEADRQLLTAAIVNLLQNAFKFSRHPGRVWLQTRMTTDRVFIDIEDQCGGLPPGQAEALFRPFLQRSKDRSGLGLGLSISRKAVEMSGGSIRVRNLPGKGCIFTVELPRARKALAVA